MNLPIRLEVLNCQNDLFSRSNELQSKETPYFADFSCAIVHEIFHILEFLCHFCKKKFWTLVKNLAMETVDPDEQNDPLRSNKP